MYPDQLSDQTIAALKEWSSLLHSDNFTQIQGTLVDECPDGSEGYCCLGIYAKYVIGVNDDYIGSNTVLSDINYDGIDIQGEVMEHCPVIETEQSWARLNDFYKLTFDQIGDVVDECIEARNFAPVVNYT